MKKNTKTVFLKMKLNELFRQIKTRKALPGSRQSVENYILTYSRLKELTVLDNYEFSADGTLVFAVPQRQDTCSELYSTRQDLNEKMTFLADLISPVLVLP